MATSTHRRPSLCVRLTRALWFVLAVGSVKPKATFYKDRVDARKAVTDAHDRLLKMIPESYTNKSSLADIKNLILVELDKEVTAQKKAFDDLPADKKTTEAELERDNKINRLYGQAVAALTHSAANTGIGMLVPFCY